MDCGPNILQELTSFVDEMSQMISMAKHFQNQFSKYTMMIEKAKGGNFVGLPPAKLGARSFQSQTSSGKKVEESRHLESSSTGPKKDMLLEPILTPLCNSSVTIPKEINFKLMKTDAGTPKKRRSRGGRKKSYELTTGDKNKRDSLETMAESKEKKSGQCKKSIVVKLEKQRPCSPFKGHPLKQKQDHCYQNGDPAPRSHSPTVLSQGYAASDRERWSFDSVSRLLSNLEDGGNAKGNQHPSNDYQVSRNIVLPRGTSTLGPLFEDDQANCSTKNKRPLKIDVTAENSFSETEADQEHSPKAYISPTLQKTAAELAKIKGLDWKSKTRKKSRMQSFHSLFNAVSSGKIRHPTSPPKAVIESFLKENNQDLEHEVKLLMQVEDDAEKRPLVISCKSKIVRIWEYIIISGGLYTAYYIPLNLGFFQFLSPDCKRVCFALSCIFMGYDVIFASDILLKSHLSFINSAHEEIKNKKKILRRYVWSFELMVDGMAAIPWGFLAEFCTAFGGLMTLLGLTRVVKLFFGSYEKRFKKHLMKTFPSLNPIVVRLFGIILTFWTLVHFYACMYSYNLKAGRFRGSWKGDSSELSYIEAIHFALSAASGNDQGPTAWFELCFASIGTLIAFFVNAVIIGSATTVLSNLDTTAVVQKKQIDAIHEFMNFRRVPRNVQHKIVSYYEYLWKTGQSSHAEKLFIELPEKLKLELSMTLHRKLIEQVPLFKALSPSGVMILVQRLKPLIILPYEIIVREGERSDGMFFINRGAVRCYTTNKASNEEVYLVSLNEGSFFGEVALLDPSVKRTANIRAICFCELRCLKNADFQVVLRAFPDFKRAIERIADARKKLSANLHKNSSRMGTMMGIKANPFFNESSSWNNYDDLDRDWKKKTFQRKLVRALTKKSRNQLLPVDSNPENERSVEFRTGTQTLFTEVLRNQKQVSRAVADEMFHRNTLTEHTFLTLDRACNR